MKNVLKKICITSLLMVIITVLAFYAKLKLTLYKEKNDELCLNGERSISQNERIELDNNLIVKTASEKNSASGKTYIVEYDNNVYRVAQNGKYYEYDSLNSLISIYAIEGSSFYFSNVKTSESLDFKNSVTLGGILEISSENLNLSGAETRLSSLTLSITDGSVRIKNGCVIAESGSVYTKNRSAFILDYSASSVLKIDGMTISSDSSAPTVYSEVGTVEVTAGSISNKYGAAIGNRGTLVLSGNPLLSGYNFAVETTSPISLSIGGKYFSSELSVMYKNSFEKGTITEVFRSADANISEKVKLYDITGERISLTFFESSKYTDECNFLAVYLPHRVNFYLDSSVYETSDFLTSEYLTAPKEPTKEGYLFSGWYKDSKLTDSYVFGTAESSDISLYAAFSLTPPEFMIKSSEFTYDGEDHYFGFEKLMHPLAENGSFSYVWYKNSEAISSSSKNIKIRNVSDSGDYYCKLTFSYMGDFVTVDTPIVSVKINKMVIDTPVISDIQYTGTLIYPTVTESDLYSFCAVGGVNVGGYDLTFTLKDDVNYAWLGSENNEKNVKYYIVRAENSFLREPSVKNCFEGELPVIDVAAKFGECKIYYSEDLLKWDSEIPTVAGQFYLKLIVEGCENYTSIESEALAFEIMKEVCVGIKLDKTPNKILYTAFEKFDFSGAVFSATYNSGRSEIIDHSRLRAEYKNGDFFLASDTCVTVFYGDISVPVAVEITLAEYDITLLDFDDREVVYDGKRHSITPTFSVVGEDGIALSLKVNGGGINAGEYSVTLSFMTDSSNYRTPDPITKRLTILPKRITAEYGNREFVYTGYAQIPTAFIINAQSLSVPLELSGAGIDAGKYKATIIFNDKNYIIENSEIEFEIKKANIDLSSAIWSGENFVYSGKLHTVTVSNLPKMVKIVGYANSSYSDAGEYTAVATLVYDEKNYNSPGVLSKVWRIIPADYDMSGFRVSDAEYVYDGEKHYPTVKGELPIGYDGSRVEYQFSGGVINVSEGRVAVNVIFTENSNNYNTPNSITAYVKILPKEIKVRWGSLEFTYDGNLYKPNAHSDECGISVIGEGVNAGNYEAHAKSLSENYRITNSKVSFTIKKAENYWKNNITADDIFEGGELKIKAEAYYGNCEYRYFTDAECNNEVYAPFSHGSYYVYAKVSESENFLPLISQTVSFEVIEVVPVKFEFKFIENPKAAAKLSDDIFEAYFVNNDSSKTILKLSDLTVVYENGNSFSALDQKVRILVGQFEIDIQVEPEKNAVRIPDIQSAVYNGDLQMPLVEESDIYYAVCEGGVDAGEYTVNFILKDAVNYFFENDVSEGLFLIEKSKVVVEVSKKGDSYLVVSGFVAENDVLGNEYTEEDGMILLIPSNPNYEITVIGAKARSGIGVKIILISLSVMMLVLLVVISVLYRERIKIFVIGAKTAIIKAFGDMTAKESKKSITKSVVSESIEESPKKLEKLLAVDETYANTLISDTLARSLISESASQVYTEGHRHTIVNLSDINANFKNGEYIDINSMKEKGILPKDAGRVKVLAGGVIDKSLFITADAFSLSAVKMIALTGGSANKSKTQKKKKSI